MKKENTKFKPRNDLFLCKDGVSGGSFLHYRHRQCVESNNEAKMLPILT